MNIAELTTAILNTLAVTSGVVFAVVPLAFVVALLIARSDAIGGRWAWLLICSQLVVPLYATVGAWNAGFGTQGWWPLAQTYAVQSRWTALGAVTFLHAIASLPSAVLILMLGLVWTQRSQEELALIEGGRRNLLRRVVLPEMRPWLAITAFWSSVPVLTEMVVTNLYQFPTLAEQVYLDVSLGSATAWTYAVSIGLGIVPLAILFAALHNHRPTLKHLRRQMAQHPARQLPLGQLRPLLSALLWCVALVVAGVPLANLLIKAGWMTEPAANGTLHHRWTAERLLQTVIETSSLFTVEFRWSATLAASAASAALASACALRWIIQITQARLEQTIPHQIERAVNVFCLILIVIPGPLVAALTTRLFLSGWIPGLDWCYDHTLLAPVLAQQTRLLPLAWLLVMGIFATISSQAWELATVDRLPLGSRLRWVLLRPTWRLWLMAWLLLAVTSVGELSTHLLLLPPGVTTVAQRLFELLHFGMRYQDSGLCLALVLIGWVVAIAVWNTRTGRA